MGAFEHADAMYTVSWEMAKVAKKIRSSVKDLDKIKRKVKKNEASYGREKKVAKLRENLGDLHQLFGKYSNKLIKAHAHMVELKKGLG